MFGQPVFTEIVCTAAWHIWILRDIKTFRNKRPSFGAWYRGLIHDTMFLFHIIKCEYKHIILAGLLPFHR
jgi:hypothetical protein